MPYFVDSDVDRAAYVKEVADISKGVHTSYNEAVKYVPTWNWNQHRPTHIYSSWASDIDRVAVPDKLMNYPEDELIMLRMVNEPHVEAVRRGWMTKEDVVNDWLFTHCLDYDYYSNAYSIATSKHSTGFILPPGPNPLRLPQNDLPYFISPTCIAEYISKTEARNSGAKATQTTTV